MPRQPANNRASAALDPDSATAIKHPARRGMIPAAVLKTKGVRREAPRFRCHYRPHLPPVLGSAPDTAATDPLPELLSTAPRGVRTHTEARLRCEVLRRHEARRECSGTHDSRTREPKRIR